MGYLAVLTLLLTLADHWTTYLCLRQPVSGWQVTEANPIADWLFGAFGLVPGLLLDSAITLGALGFLLMTRMLPSPAKIFFFGFIAVWTSYAVFNNLQALDRLGLSPLGLV